MSIWSGVLDSCPGLLCCVINIHGKLLHATHGYKAVAFRLFGHKCEEGKNYPPMITELDRGIHEALTAACLGDTNAIEFSENGKIWELTASPLKVDESGIAGVVIKISSELQQPAAKNDDDKNGTQTVTIQSNPEILNSIPFRAGIVDSHGVFMAVNKFLASCVRADLVGRNVIELVDPVVNSDLLHIIVKRSGSVECTMPDISACENFYPSGLEPYLDEEFNELSRDEEIEIDNDVLRRVKLHATPSEWNGEEAVMLTFEDVTEFQRNHEQLRRLLTVDRHTGILNRLGIEQVTGRLLSEKIQEYGHLSIILIRIENYRELNEALGYVPSNRILRSFVRTMQRFLSEDKKEMKCVIGRWYHDEFIIAAQCSGAAAVVAANEIRGRSKSVKLSCGVSDLTDGYASVSEFIGAAYGAMAEAVKSGGSITVLAGHK